MTALPLTVLYMALPASLRRIIPEYERCRAQAEIIGMLDAFDDVMILGNDAMRARPGRPYQPRDVLQTLCERHF